MKAGFFLLLALALFTGCKKPGCTGNAGETTFQERFVPDFQRIQLEDNIDLELVQSDINKLEITGPQNIIANIEATITGDTLIIRNSTSCRWLRAPDERVKIKLFFKRLISFQYDGSGNVTNQDTLQFSSFYFKSDKGAGSIELTMQNSNTWIDLYKENANIILHGSSNYCYSFTNARAQTDLNDFKVNKMEMIYIGLADTHIWVTDELNLELRYRGNVYYRGNPVITKADFFSSGQLIRVP
jgi:hypothetical protein